MAEQPKIPQYNHPLTQDGSIIDRTWYGALNLLFARINLRTSWTTANRPTNVNAGYVGYNTTTAKFEGFDGTNWINLN